MKPEPETIFKKYNCPYKFDDPRAVVWLEGWAAGYEQGANSGIEALERLAGTRS